MDLRQYYFSLPDERARADFVRRAEISRAYLHQLICFSERSKRHPGPKVARRLRAASGDAISLSSMRSDLWPEGP